MDNNAETILHKYCEACGQPFEIEKPLEAPHKRFCSTACRSHFHYIARKAAKAMALAADNIPGDFT
jgi:hypothetical protein